MIVLDANVVIGHLTPSDAHHVAAGELMLGSEVLLMHPMTLTEVLVGGVKAGRGPQLVETVREMGIDVSEPDAGEPLRLAELRVRTGCRLPDCCVLELAMRDDAAVATFDVRLARAAAGLGLEVVGVSPS